MTTKGIDTAAVMEIAHKNPTSEAVFTVLALRERARGETDLRRLKDELRREGFAVVPQHFNTVFESLAKQAFGEVTFKGDEPIKFKWHYSLKEVAQTAFGGKRPRIVVPRPESIVERVYQPGLIVVLGKERMARIDLPDNFTAGEASSLAKILLTRAKTG